MKCQKCQSERVAEVQAHCSDMCFVRVGSKEHDGYVPSDLKIGGGDDVRVDICLDCGQAQGVFPVPISQMEGGTDDPDWNCGGCGKLVSGALEQCPDYPHGSSNP